MAGTSSIKEQRERIRLEREESRKQKEKLMLKLQQVKKELKSYSPKLSKKKELVVLNKTDLINKNKIILTDCDGVCLDWEYGFHTWMSTHGHELKHNNLYSVAKQYEMTDENAKRQVEIFNSSASMGFF